MKFALIFTILQISASKRLRGGNDFHKNDVLTDLLNQYSSESDSWWNLPEDVQNLDVKKKT